MNNYCEKKIKKGLGFCHRVNARVPNCFCQINCNGNWQKYYRPDVEEARSQARKPLIDEQLDNKDMVSVIIPVRDERPDHIEKTVHGLFETAIGAIEVIVACDGCEDELDCRGNVGIITCFYPEVVGQRKITNDAVDAARGKYIFRLDGHCKMSDGWDARMKASCADKTIVVATFDGLDPDTFEPLGKDLAYCILKPSLRKMFVRNWMPIEDRPAEVEMMTLTGTAWMVTKEYYLASGGHDESLGGFGAIGAEWSLRTWLTGGRVLLRCDVVCYHYFKKQNKYAVRAVITDGIFQRLYKQWIEGHDQRIIRPAEWLWIKFEKYTKSPLMYKRTPKMVKGRMRLVSQPA